MSFTESGRLPLHSPHTLLWIQLIQRARLDGKRKFVLRSPFIAICFKLWLFHGVPVGQTDARKWTCQKNECQKISERIIDSIHELYMPGFSVKTFCLQNLTLPAMHSEIFLNHYLKLKMSQLIAKCSEDIGPLQNGSKTIGLLQA